jgi:signal transduction histidine kinase
LTTLAERCATPVVLEVASDERYPEAVETAAYFLVSESLTKVARHACAARAKLIVRRYDGTLMVEVADDGRGGADFRSGSGLRGLMIGSARLAAA